MAKSFMLCKLLWKPRLLSSLTVLRKECMSHCPSLPSFDIQISARRQLNRITIFPEKSPAALPDALIFRSRDMPCRLVRGERFLLMVNLCEHDETPPSTVLLNHSWPAVTVHWVTVSERLVPAWELARRQKCWKLLDRAVSPLVLALWAGLACVSSA